MRPELEANHTPPSNAEVKKACKRSILPYIIMKSFGAEPFVLSPAVKKCEG
jgi:hypothetical protein